MACLPDQPPPPEARRRIVKAALLRPMALLMALIGMFFFAVTLAWWAVPLTLATYASLVFLATRDPAFQSRVLGKENPPTNQVDARRRGPRGSAEQRVRQLPRGETRQRVEAALEVHGRILVAVRESDEATRAMLDEAVPKFHQIAERLVDVAEAREEASAQTGPGGKEQAPVPEENLRTADAQLSGALEDLLALRTKVVRVSIQSNDAARVADILVSLDALNDRLDALASTISSPKDANSSG